MQLHTCTHSRVPLLSFSFPLILLLHRYYFSSFSSFLLLISHIFLPLYLWLLFTDVAESLFHFLTWTRFRYRDWLRTYTRVHTQDSIYIYCALVFSVFIASYHLPFFRDSLLFRGGADRSPFFRGIIYPSKIIRLIIEELVSRSSGGGRGV